jgi:serine/threonine protein kinase
MIRQPLRLKRRSLRTTCTAKRRPRCPDRSKYKSWRADRFPKEDYEAACTAQVAAFAPESKDVAFDPKDECGDGIDPDGPDIGRYKKATFHRAGLFSTIMKALSEDSLGEGSGVQASMTVVALKVTVPSTMTAPHDSQREARILKQVKCPQIIRLVSTFWQPSGRLVLVFPFMPFDLERMISASSFNDILVRGVTRDIFKGLAYIHALGIIHRDVKPSNILLRSCRGPAYLADFGIAWSGTDAASEPSQQKISEVGTTRYRPPEVLFGCTFYDTSLDLWAAGCTVSEMIQPSHRSIFDGGDLGSELALIKSIFSTLGTPNEELWPVCPLTMNPLIHRSSHIRFQSVSLLPDWGKVRFLEYPAKLWSTILEGASGPAVAFVSNLVQYECSWRMSAIQVRP